MKIQKHAILLFIVLASLYSCDKIDELTEFDVDGNFTTTITVEVAEDPNGEPQSFSQSGTINIAQNQDIQDNFNKIESIAINSLTYEITNFSGVEGAVITNASISFGATTIQVTDINVQQADADNQVFSVNNTQQLNAIAAALKNSPSLTVTISGSVNDTPVNFNVVVKANVTVTIDAA